jgi:hypothetical protein
MQHVVGFGGPGNLKYDFARSTKPFCKLIRLRRRIEHRAENHVRIVM